METCRYFSLKYPLVGEMEDGERMKASIEGERRDNRIERGRTRGGQLPQTVGLRNPMRGSFSFVKSGQREREPLKNEINLCGSVTSG